MRKNKNERERLENNRVSLKGMVVSPFMFSHEVMGERFYLIHIEIPRLSEQADRIPLMISERIVDINKDMTGRKACVSGQFRSYNRHEEGKKNRLELSAFIQEIAFSDQQGELEEISKDPMSNLIELDGYICKAPVYRRTPLGREITDILLAVNRSYGKSDYIPIILWGRNARYAAGMEIGTRIQIFGRIQSRDYIKKMSDGEIEKRVAYEVSGRKVDILSKQFDS